jgi:hypothetical protein
MVQAFPSVSNTKSPPRKFPSQTPHLYPARSSLWRPDLGHGGCSTATELFSYLRFLFLLFLLHRFLLIIIHKLTSTRFLGSFVVDRSGFFTCRCCGIPQASRLLVGPARGTLLAIRRCSLLLC